MACPSVDPMETPFPSLVTSLEVVPERIRVRGEGLQGALDVCVPGSGEDFAAWHENKAFLLSPTMRVSRSEPPQGDFIDKEKVGQVRCQKIGLFWFRKLGIFVRG